MSGWTIMDESCIYSQRKAYDCSVSRKNGAPTGMIKSSARSICYRSLCMLCCTIILSVPIVLDTFSNPTNLVPDLSHNTESSENQKSCWNKKPNVGGVGLKWFGIWLETVWLTFWAAKVVSKAVPFTMRLVVGAFTNNHGRWYDTGEHLKLPVALLLWWFGVIISFSLMIRAHLLKGCSFWFRWQDQVYMVLVSTLIGLSMNLFSKILIQLIAVKFNFRTYSDKIELNRLTIQCLIKLHIYKDRCWATSDCGEGCTDSSRQPQCNVACVSTELPEATRDTHVRKMPRRGYSQQAVLDALKTPEGSKDLGRRLFGFLVYKHGSSGADTRINWVDMIPAFDNDEEAEYAFDLFDRDFNGDIGVEDFAEVCVTVGLDRRDILVSLGDLNEILGKLDKLCMTICCISTVVIYLSLMASINREVLASVGATILALSWLLAASAQELLQSMIFVFIKHPFDVGDRIKVYGNTGSNLQGDEYFVKRIALLYTELRKHEGLVVQAPNSYLNTLFIMNMRRSGALSESIPFKLKYGTTVEDINIFRNRAIGYVRSERRDFRPDCLIEVTGLSEINEVCINAVVFYKSYGQDECLHMQRRTKFLCALMNIARDTGLESSQMCWLGSRSASATYAAGCPISSTQNSRMAMI